MRRVVLALWGVLLLCATCSARQLPDWVGGSAKHQPGIPAVDRTPVSAATLDLLTEQIAQQIVKKHLKNVAVIGVAGPVADEPTQYGLEFGDKFSADLARLSQGFHVEDRGALRDYVKKLGLSDVMIVSDGLANWIAAKAGMDGFVVVKFTRVASGGATVVATLYRTDKEDGTPLSASSTRMNLTPEQFTDRLRVIESNWNKDTHSPEEYRKLPPRRQATCTSCPKPDYTGTAREQHASNQVVKIKLTVFPDGKAGDIAIIKSAPYGLTTISVETILHKWQFQPALDADGKPTATRLPVEIMFQLY